MKQVRFLIGMLLTMSLLFTFGFCASAENLESVTIGDQVGTLDKSVTGGGHQMFTSNGIVINTDDGKKAILDPLGENKLGKTYDEVDHFGNEEGLFVVTDLSRLPNALSLVKADGTVLLEDAAIIDPLASSPVSGSRFAEVSVAVSETEYEEECFLFAYASAPAIDIRMEPGKGDTMYTGYMRIFDLQEKCFVENVKINFAGDRIDLVGKNLLINYDDYEKEDELYSPEGELIAAVKGSDRSRDYFVSRTEDKTYSVQDCNLNELAVLEFSPYRVYGNAEVFANKTDDGFLVVDREGEEISDILFRYAPDWKGAFLIGEDAEGNCAVITLDGKVLLPFDAGVKTVYERPLGYFEVRYQDDSYAVLTPDGDVIPLKSNLTMDLLSYINLDDVHEVYIFEDQSCSNTEGLIYSVGRMLYSVRNKDGKFALYCAADGCQLIEPKYEYYAYSNGYIYAEHEGYYDIYTCIFG